MVQNVVHNLYVMLITLVTLCDICDRHYLALAASNYFRTSTIIWGKHIMDFDQNGNSVTTCDQSMSLSRPKSETTHLCPL